MKLTDREGIETDLFPESHRSQERQTYREQSQLFMSELTKGIPNNQIEFLKKLSSFPKHPIG